MIRNYLKLYFRNIAKNMLFIVINVLGLAIGITVFLLIFNYVSFHKSFDKQYKSPENIYRVNTETYVDGKESGKFGVTMQFLAPELRKFPEVEDATRLFSFELMFAYKDAQKFYDLAIYGADSTIFDFFGFKLLSGDRKHALGEPFTAVLTERTAKKMFGTTNVVGKTIQTGYGFHEPVPYQVTGVMADLPVNSHINFDILLSSIEPNSVIGNFTIFNGGDPTYHYPAFNTYIRLKDKVDPAKLQARLPAFLNSRIKGVMDKYGQRRLFLEPITKIHLGPKYQWSIDTLSGMRADESSEFAVNWISFFALLLLLFSIFNFLNLSLIFYARRAKELETRKKFGARPIQFLTQFFLESLITISFALVIAIVLLLILKRPYYSYLGLPPEYSIFIHWQTYVYIFVFFIGLLVVKVFFLFLISVILKLFDTQKRSKEVALSKYLVVLQYMGAFILASLTIIISQQLKYMMSKDLGYKSESILVIRKYTMGSGLSSLDLSYLETFKTELLRLKNINKVCLSSVVPGYYHHSNQRTWMNANDQVQSNTIWIDKDYADVYGLKFLAGKALSDPERNEVVINKTLMNELGVKDAADMVGKQIYIDDVAAHHIAPGAKTVVGVLDNYYQEPLNRSIAPVKYHYEDANRGYYSIKYHGSDPDQVVKNVKEVFTKFYPGDEFQYFFLDDFMNQQYKSDIQFKQLTNLSAYLSLLIASMGILGLITYSVQVHRKSIAIRKVLGGDIFHIFSVFARKYLIYFGWAIVLAVPLIIIFSNIILNNYAYHTRIQYTLLLIPVFLILAAIVIIICFQVVRATRENPIKSLKAD